GHAPYDPPPPQDSPWRSCIPQNQYICRYVPQSHGQSAKHLSLHPPAATGSSEFFLFRRNQNRSLLAYYILPSCRYKKGNTSPLLFVHYIINYWFSQERIPAKFAAPWAFS